MSNPPSESSDSKSTAFIVQPVFPVKKETGKPRIHVPDPADQLSEIESLVKAISLEVCHSYTVKVARPNPSRLIGKGACKEIERLIEEHEPSVVVVNHMLSPVQQRNLENTWNAKVIDRTGLILEIFGERAQTKEGRIQVELAALDYQRSRLVRSWTHLERQRGGAGFLGGPGERQIELDRRMLADRMKNLRRDLEQVRKTRELQRKSRERVPFPIVALVGYTNAGKSTLFNKLTGANVFVEDLLFATLDPTMRKMELDGGQEVILSDTVGFIADLPTHLIASFRATLEQTQFADVIVHVRDMARPDNAAQKENVIQILKDLEIEYEYDSRVIEVFNKVDLLDEEDVADIQRKCKFNPQYVALSAVTGEGEESLLEAIDYVLAQQKIIANYKLKSEDGRALAWLYEHGKVLERQDVAEGEKLHITVSVQMDSANLGRFKQRFLYDPV